MAGVCLVRVTLSCWLIFKPQWTKNYPVTKHGEGHLNAVHLSLILLSTCQIEIGQSFYSELRARGFDSLCHNVNKFIISQRHDSQSSQNIQNEVSQLIMIMISRTLMEDVNLKCRKTTDLCCCLAEVEGGGGSLLGRV